MRLLILGKKTPKLERALKGVGLPLQLVYMPLDVKNLAWEEYTVGKLGIAKSLIKTSTKDIFNALGWSVDVVVFSIPAKHWRAKTTLGWGMGGLWNTYGVIQIKEDSSFADTIEHELWHLLDSFKTMFPGWDELAVHGASPAYGQWRKDLKKYYYKTKSGKHINLETLRAKHAQDYTDAIAKRKQNSDRVALMQKILLLQQQVLQMLRQKKEPEVITQPTPQKITKLLPLVERKANEFIAKATTQGYTLRVTSGLRSFEEQDAIYAQGRTAPGRIVTNARGGESGHNYGYCIDIVDRYRGYNIDWNQLGAIGKSCGFLWGGDWASFIDRPHFEYPLKYKLSDFQQNKVALKDFA